MNISGNNPEKNTQGNSEKQNIFTKETLGVVLVLFATLCLVCLITRDSVFSAPGRWVNNFFFGCFGYFAYLVLGVAFYYGIVCITGKRVVISKKIIAYAWIAVGILALLVHVISMRDFVGSYGDYVSASYSMATVNGIATCSAGGFFTGIIAYIFPLILGKVGSYVVLSILFALCIFAIVKTVQKEKLASEPVGSKGVRSSFVKNSMPVIPDAGVTIDGEKDYPIDLAVPTAEQGTQKLFVVDAKKDDFRAKPKTKNGEVNQLKVDYTNGGLGVASAPVSYSQSYSGDIKSKLDYIKTPAPINVQNNAPSYYQADVQKTTVSDYISREQVKKEEEKPLDQEQPVVEEIKPSVTSIPLFEHEETVVRNDAQSHADRFSSLADIDETQVDTTFVQPVEVVRPINMEEPSVQNDVQDYSSNEQAIGLPLVEETPEQTFEENLYEDIENEQESIIEPIVDDTPIEDAYQEPEIEVEEPPVSRVGRDRVRNIFLAPEDNLKDEKVEEEKPAFTSRVQADGNLSSTRRMGFAVPETPKEPEVEEKPPKPAPPINREYFRPPFDLLRKYERSSDAPVEDHAKNMEIIKQTLASFHINTEPQGYVQGPSITRYEITMPEGISVKKVLGYEDDLRMRLESEAGVRVEAPIPGKNLVGVEVANKHPQTVGLREVLELSAQKNPPAKPGSLMFALGKDIVGNPVTDNLAKGPHYLVAGATGSGKSVCLNAMLVSLIMRYSPEELKLFLVDPKGVEFVAYEHLPHLMIDEIITSPQKAIEMLKWAYDEMQRRFQVFRDCDAFVVDIDGYNSQVASDTVAKMPRIVIVIDELADLMQTCKKDLESRICAIAQKARSAGIHLVLATQRPSVDVITGTIKANLPSRIAFKVMNFADSQTILSEAGADKLLGNGDMLYKNSQMPGVARYQGAFIHATEVNNVVTYIKEHNVAYFDDELKDFLEKAANPQPEPSSFSDGGETGGAPETNDIFLRALWFAVTSGTISISSMQRRFGIGFSRAGNIMDKMDRMGFVSPNEGSKARRVLLTREEYAEKFGEAPPEEF